jgi:hypothetical protein
MFKCEFCSQEFTAKSSLNTHQKTAKYCLQLQEKEIESFICNFCQKEFSLKPNLLRHIDICKAKKNLEEENKEEKIDRLNDELNVAKTEILLLKKEISNYQSHIEEKNQKIEKLENHILKLSEKPTTTNNTTNNNQRYSQIIQNLSPITQENFDDLSSKLEEKHITNGPYGYVAFAKENFKNKLLCTDMNRKNLKYKNAKNHIITDVNGKEFTYQFFSSIQQARQILVEEQKNKATNPSLKLIVVNHYGEEDVCINSLLKRKEESAFSNKFMAILSSDFYIKNIQEQENILSDDNLLEYIVESE